MKIDNLIEIAELLKDDSSKNKCSNGAQGLIKIVILQRGWVVVGRFYQEASNCWIEEGFVIRKWGTTKGLGELALNGKQSETVLDSIPKTEFHQLTIVASMLCDQKKWK